jgi:hypothetical protein
MWIATGEVACVKTDFGEPLRSFLKSLEPALRRYLLGEATIADVLAKPRLPAERKNAWDAATHEYHRLLLNDPVAWKHFRQEQPGLASVLAQTVAGRTGKAGTPKKPLEQSVEVRLVREADRLAQRLFAGFKACKRHRGRLAPDVRLLSQELRQMKYGADEIAALLPLNSRGLRVVPRTPNGAVVRLLAARLKRQEDSVGRALRRGRKLLGSSKQ